MPIRVQLPNGRIAEFPDGMSNAEIEAAIAASDQRDIVEDSNFVAQGARWLGRAAGGLMGSVGTALDVASPDRAPDTVVADDSPLRVLPGGNFLANSLNRADEITNSAMAAIGRGVGAGVEYLGAEGLGRGIAAGADTFNDDNTRARAEANARRAAAGQVSLEQQNALQMGNAAGEAIGGAGRATTDYFTSDESRANQTEFGRAWERGIVPGLEFTVANPGTTADVVAPSLLESMAPAGLIGRGAKLGLMGVARAAADDAERLALAAGKNELEVVAARTEALVAGTLRAERGAMGTAMGVQAAQATEMNARQQVDAIRFAPLEELRQNPEFVELEAQLGEASARAALAQRVFDANAVVGLPLNAAAAFIPGRLGLQPVESALAGGARATGAVASLPGAAGRVARAGLHGAQEFAGEAIQGGTEQFVQNVAGMPAGTATGYLDDVGTNAVMEGVVGFGAGGVAGAFTGPAAEGAARGEALANQFLREAMPVALRREPVQDMGAVDMAAAAPPPLGAVAAPAAPPAASGEPGGAAPPVGATPATSTARMPSLADVGLDLSNPSDDLERQLAAAGAAPVLAAPATAHAMEPARASYAERMASEGVPEEVRPGLAEAYERADVALPTFEQGVNAVASAIPGATVKLPGLKSIKRASEKVVGDYNGDATRIKDIVRGTLVVKSVADADTALKAIAQQFGDNRIMVKRSTLAPDSKPTSSTGYRDALVTVDIDGTPTELQVSTPEMIAAKKAMHPKYVRQQEIERAVGDRLKARADELRGMSREQLVRAYQSAATPEERMEHRALRRAQSAAYSAAFAEATSRSNSASSMGAASSSNRAEVIGSRDAPLNTNPPMGPQNAGSPPTSPYRTDSSIESASSVTGASVAPESLSDQARTHARRLQVAVTAAEAVEGEGRAGSGKARVFHTAQEARAAGFSVNDNQDAFYDPDSDTVGIIADKTPDADRALWTTWHERSGHRGLIGTFGDSPALVAEMKRAGGNEIVRKVADALKVDRQSPDMDDALAVEEALSELQAAHRTGNWSEIASRYGVEASDLTKRTIGDVLRRLLRALRAAITGTGAKSSAYSNDEVMQLLEDSHKRGMETVTIREALKEPGGEPVQPEQRGRDGRRGSEAGRGAAPRAGAPLRGAPNEPGATGPDPRLNAVAERYARENGIELKRQAEYAKVDVARAERIAAAYAAMEHAPQDPRVKAAYADLIAQTMAQYRALEADGFKFWFMDPAADPYEGNPWNAMRDLRATQSMAVFPSDAGFGSGDTDLNVDDNPLLADTGIRWPYGAPDGELRPVLANDLFRAVHDAFGHGIEGAGFRARGEENAWQAHARLFTGAALGALTSETRGQNSWLNFGPHGETNRTASVEDTVFADQKTGLMPEWTWTEGRVGDAASRASVARDQTDTPEFKRWFGDSKVVDADGKPLVVYHGTDAEFDAFDMTQTGIATDHPAAGLGVHFTDSREAATQYGERTVGAYIAASNPKRYTTKQYVRVLRDLEDGNLTARDLRDELIAAGYDGIVAAGDQYDGTHYVAFRPNQIKSATGNRGTFDPNDPNIRASTTRPAATARADAAAKRAIYGDLSQQLREALATTGKMELAAGRARRLIGEVSAMGDIEAQVRDARRELAAAQRGIDVEGRAALVEYDRARDAVATLQRAGREAKAKAAEANRLLDTLERAERGGTLATRQTEVERLIDVVEAAREAYEAAATLRDWRRGRERAVAVAHKKRGETLNRLAAEGMPQGNITWTLDKAGRDSALRKARRLLQDKMIDVRDIGDSISAAFGTALPDMLNLYQAENLMHGKAEEGIEALKRTLVDPLKAAIKAAGVTNAEVHQYLWARHAEERNKRIASINPGMPDGGSGMDTAKARQVLADFARDGKTAKLEAIGKRVQAIRHNTLDTLLRSGQITPELHNRLSTMYAHYVPLRGDPNAEEGEARVGTGRGLDVRGKPTQRALGRNTEPRDILGELVGDAERAILQGAKADVGRTLLRMALQFPNKDVWQVEPVTVEPKFSEATGEVYLAVAGADPENTVIVKHNGKPYAVKLVDPKLRDAVLNYGMDGTEAIAKLLGWANRWMSAVSTRFNPAFVGVNMIRDALQGSMAIGSELGAGALKDSLRLYLPAMRAMWQAGAGAGDAKVADASKSMVDWAREFAEAGGKTGHASIADPETIQQRIEDEMAGIGQLLRARRPVAAISQALQRSTIIETIERANDSAENALRLAVYTHLRKSGSSTAKAAQYAKNVTINFNRRGQITGALNALYLFFNASMQGGHRTLQLLADKRVLGTLAGIGAAQAALAITMGALHYEDEDETLWEQIPDYVREKAFVIPLGFSEEGDPQYVAIPMPFGFNLFTMVGGYPALVASDTWRARQDKSWQATMLADVARSSIDAFSVMPLGEEGWFMPTLARMQQNFAANKDDLGNSIRSMSAQRGDAPRAYAGKADANEAARAVAVALNRIGGGDEVTKPVAWLDYAPEDIEYMIGRVTGGAGNTLQQLLRVGTRAVHGLDIAPGDIPIASRIVGSQRRERVDQRLYYEASERMDAGLDRLRIAFVEGGVDEFEQEKGKLGPAFDGVVIARYKTNDRDGAYRRGDFRIDSDTGRPTFVAIPGSVFASYKDAKRNNDAFSEAVKATYASNLLSSLERAEKIEALQIERAQRTRDFMRLWNQAAQ